MTSPPRPRRRAAALALALTAVLALGATACGADTSATKTSTGTSSSAVKDGTAVTTLDAEPPVPPDRHRHAGQGHLPGPRPLRREDHRRAGEGGREVNGLLALAFAAGMLAPVNPCGFALLPAWITHSLGEADTSPLP